MVENHRFNASARRTRGSLAVGAGVAWPSRRLPLFAAATVCSSSHSSIMSGLPHGCETVRRRTHQIVRSTVSHPSIL